MANISMKFVLLVAVVAVLCSISSGLCCISDVSGLCIGCCINRMCCNPSITTPGSLSFPKMYITASSYGFVTFRPLCSSMARATALPASLKFIVITVF
uniref:Putative secreted protein n=1 Tax=Panstrongylus lignarius TaxID=156445 RepID=A0A224Y3D6_9HEMI